MERIILLKYQKKLVRYRSKNNFVELIKIIIRKLIHDEECCKRFNIFIISLRVLLNYFYDLTKLFPDLHLVKFLDQNLRLFYTETDFAEISKNFARYFTDLKIILLNHQRF